MNTEESKTVAIKTCHACGGSLLERDRFCRWCSARQVEPTLIIDSGAIECVSPTVPLIEAVSPTESFRPVSGPLARAVARGVAAAERGHLSSRLARRCVLALISMPIWLIIVLLSPIDAYFVAKAVTRS
ncbi:MAG: hypothetical protein AB1631_08185 [Acidobacteriota bacterium]